MFRFKTFKWFLFIIGVLIMATVAYTFAAANTLPPVTGAGEGSNPITGYTVSAIHYILNAVPTTIDSVTFTLSPVPVSGSTIKIQLVDAGTWYTCTNVTPPATCTTTGATVVSAAKLTVVVAD